MLSISNFCAILEFNSHIVENSICDSQLLPNQFCSAFFFWCSVSAFKLNNDYIFTKSVQFLQKLWPNDKILKRFEEMNNITASIMPLEKKSWLTCLIFICNLSLAILYAKLIVSTLPLITCTVEQTFITLRRVEAYHDSLRKKHKKVV